MLKKLSTFQRFYYFDENNAIILLKIIDYYLKKEVKSKRF